MGAVAQASLDRGTARAATRALRDTLQILDERGARMKPQHAPGPNLRHLRNLRIKKRTRLLT